VEIPCSSSKRMNVFGIYSTANEFYPFTTEGKIDSDFVINAFDIFAKDLSTPTVVIIDNAPIHTSNKFLAKVEEWIDSNLYVFFLPKYSPHLNLIELLWRKIKYEWIDIKAFNSWEELTQNVKTILNNIGTEFKITFK
jgi:transposase